MKVFLIRASEILLSMKLILLEQMLTILQYNIILLYHTRE